MALKGTLKDFSMADIFQLIAHQQKSGSLYLTNDNQVCHIMFDSGNVVIGRFKQSNEDLMIGNMMLRAGILEEEQLQEALDDQQSTLRSIGDILLTMNYITPDLLRKFIKLQIDEVLFRLFQWKEGLYEFVTEEFTYNKKILKTHRTEQLLLDGFRMLDEWPAVLSKIASLDTVYKPIVDTSNLESFSPPEKKDEAMDDEIDMAFKEYDEDKPEPKQKDKSLSSFSEEEKTVISLIDGRRKVQEIADLSMLGTFGACSKIASLVDKKAVTSVELSSPSRSDTQAAFKSAYVTKKTTLYRVITDFIVIAVIITALPSLIFYYSSRTAAEGKKENGFFINTGENPLDSYFDGNKLSQIKFALELYRIEADSYPDNLDELVAGNFLPASDIVRNLYFRKTGDTYILIP